ncbi:hypothetical protein CATRI_11915 [Corynebacterium atrinae]|nr:hypothetical protein CATRI_11915 [Corynebacterium atrinae]
MEVFSIAQLALRFLVIAVRVRKDIDSWFGSSGGLPGW